VPEPLRLALSGCGRIAERGYVPAIAASEAVEIRPLVVPYLNRLSDLLFILSRAANATAGRDEPLWKPGATR